MKGILSILFATCVFAGGLFAQDTFPSTCPSGKTAHFPGAAANIDTVCGLQGTPDTKLPGEAPQNQAKNNFCADAAAAAPITLPTIASLQKKAAKQEKKLGFKPGEPPTDRSFLKDLGEGNLVVFEGFLFEARQECKESVNCGANPPDQNASHDIHIALLAKPRTTKASDPTPVRDKEECTGFVAEMTPHHRPAEWNACNVEDIAKKGLRVRVTGQQFFDGSHVPCTNGKPSGGDPSRISLWEIHPIYSFEVCPSGDCATGGWQPLETFAAGKTTCAEKKCD